VNLKDIFFKGLAVALARVGTSVAWSVALTAESAISVAGWAASLVASADSLAARRESTLLIKYELMVSAASRLLDLMLPVALTSAGGREGGALPSALLASCHNTLGLGSLLALARVSALVASLSCLTRRLAAFLRAQNLGVPALAESLRFIISRVSLVR
jgi:hypothetical protein